MAPRPSKQPLPGAEPDLFDDAPTMVRPTRRSHLEGLIDDALLELEVDGSGGVDEQRAR